MAELQKALRELKTEFGSVASAVVSRDGLLIAADFPEGIAAETFTIMAATMMGAASTAHSELRIGQPKFMRVTSDRHEMFLADAGRKAIVISIVPIGAKTDELKKKLDRLVQMVIEG